MEVKRGTRVQGGVTCKVTGVREGPKDTGVVGPPDRDGRDGTSAKTMDKDVVAEVGTGQPKNPGSRLFRGTERERGGGRFPGPGPGTMNDLQRATTDGGTIPLLVGGDSYEH